MSMTLVAALGCLLAPVSAPISAPYRQPACAYCPGHRTVDFGTTSTSTTVVLSPVAGTVRFAGEVAGTVYVTIEPLADPALVVTVGAVGLDLSPGLAAGRTLARGAAIGSGPGVVTLSLRRTENGGEASYLDPTPWLGRPRPRLVPRDRTAARPAAPGLVCPARSSVT